ncbi:5-hydroxytryptamine receptor 1A-alpha [Trachymyrmex septentrionalis]|uniref:5-hydroxytryptamine receptor 1A-alpha n=1 Tax=Trachymyrmex septentrionalis TaxID=34720 RepID=A0A195FGW2_9HYME|nr:5-hydroxytryptamine receptor 1A-alpha [Trachymyrmex septentrionalis]
MEHKQTILLAPLLSNSSCWRSGTSDAAWTGPGPGELIRAALILFLSLGILCANLLVICVINSRQYSKYIHAQPRYLLTSLASNDLAIGLLVTPFGFLPAVYGCWPYGEVVCQIQALLRGALTQQSAVILVCMAIDRYVCMLHPHRYHKHSSKGCVAVMSTTWIASVAIFGVLVLPRGGYYFNGSGLLACDPFFARASLRILACCCFYFPTTMVLMYCYGSAFHVNKLRLKRVVCVNTPEVVSGGHIERENAETAASRVARIAKYYKDRKKCKKVKKYHTRHVSHLLHVIHQAAQDHFLMPTLSNVYFCLSHEKVNYCKITNKKTSYIFQLVAHERRLSTSASRTMAAMSLGFIVMVTPWTIQEVVAACTGSKPPPFLDFLATWLALSNSFWNPFLYWLLNNHFRRISREFLYTKILCRSKPLGTKQHCCSTSTGGLDVCSIAGIDLSGLERCSMERCSMARCSSLSLANTPPLPWETGHVTHGDVAST